MVAHRTGEHLHLPELLRQRAETRLAHGAEPGDGVADLTEAARVAGEQGALVARLRAAGARPTCPRRHRPPAGAPVLAGRGRNCPPSPATDDMLGGRRPPGH